MRGENKRLDVYNIFLGIYSWPDYPMFYQGVRQKGDKMKKKLLYLPLALFLFLNISGCWFIVGGAVGAAGAYVVSKDTIQGDTDKPYEALWNAALTVGKIRGIVRKEDAVKGTIEMEAESSKVWIKFIRLTEATTRIRISARKYHMPNLTLAQDLYAKILEEVK